MLFYFGSLLATEVEETAVVQNAMKLREALAEGSFEWSEMNLRAVRHNDDELDAKTLRLDDCHSEAEESSCCKSIF